MRIATWAASLIAAVALGGGASSISHAQQLPEGDIKLIAAFPAGSGSDIVVRYFADKLKPLANRTIIVENKPGAGGNIATEFVARAKPDGMTIYLHTGSSMAANMHIFRKPPVDVTKALQAVATINKQAFMLVVHPDKPWKTLAELTAYLKEKGDKATYGYSATSGNVMGALYKERAKLASVPVAYKMASDSMNDLASGAIDYGLLDPQFTMGQVNNNRLRVLGIASGERQKSNPELPTMREQGVDMDLNGWFAAFVPSATPRATVDQFNKWFNQILASEETQKFLAQFASDPLISTPDEAQARLIQEIDAWGEYVRIANIEKQG